MNSSTYTMRKLPSWGMKYLPKGGELTHQSTTPPTHRLVTTLLFPNRKLGDNRGVMWESKLTKFMVVVKGIVDMIFVVGEKESIIIVIQTIFISTIQEM